MGKKTCVIYNMAASYRAPVFSLIDREMEVDWYFSDPDGSVKEMDLSLLRRVRKLPRVAFRGLVWQKGAVGLLRRDEYDSYVILGEPFSLSTWMMLLLRPIVARNKGIFLWSHGWYGREGKVKRVVKRLFFGLADTTFLYGDHARRVAVSQGFDGGRLCVVHNSLDFNRHSEILRSLRPGDVYRRYFGNGLPTVVYLGRLTTVKKLPMLVEAAAMLKTEGFGVNLVFVGDGPERERLERMATDCDVPAWFCGESYDEERNGELLYNADLCVSPGNVGLTAIHSMSFGTPVVTHGNFACQMPEFEAVVEGVTGDFFEEGSVAGLAGAMRRWLETHKDRREEVRNACVAEVRRGWTPSYQLSVIRGVVDRWREGRK